MQGASLVGNNSLESEISMLVLKKLDDVGKSTTDTAVSVAKIEGELKALGNFTTLVMKNSEQIGLLRTDVNGLCLKDVNQQKEINEMKDNSKWLWRTIIGAVIVSVVIPAILYFLSTKGG